MCVCVCDMMWCADWSGGDGLAVRGGEHADHDADGKGAAGEARLRRRVRQVSAQRGCAARARPARLGLALRPQ